jgi:hypothetical protein
VELSRPFVAEVARNAEDRQAVIAQALACATHLKGLEAVTLSP